MEHHSEEAYEEEHVIEIDETGKKKVTSKSSKSALAGSRATASIETKENGVSKKATMEAIEEKSAVEHAKAMTNGNTTVEAIDTNTEETKKITGSATTPNNNKKKVRKIKKGSGDSEKENISVVSVNCLCAFFYHFFFISNATCVSHTHKNRLIKSFVHKNREKNKSSRQTNAFK